MKQDYTEEELTTFKTCKTCSITKHLSEFLRNHNGHEPWCKDCRNGRPNTYTGVPTPQGKRRSRKHVATDTPRKKTIRTKEKHPDVIPKEKVCLKCGRLLPLDDFHRNPAHWTGRLTRCKECVLGHAPRKPKVQFDHRIIMPDEIPIIEEKKILVAPPNPYLNRYRVPRVKAKIQDGHRKVRCISCRDIITPEVGNPGPHGVYGIRCQSCRAYMIAIPVVS